MPPREWNFRIEDMLECVEKIRRYTKDMDVEAFKQSNITIDAVLRNIEILGEAAHHVPDSVAALAPEIPWRQIRGMRNILAHQYFGADVDTVWNTITVNIPPLIEPLQRLLRSRET